MQFSAFDLFIAFTLPGFALGWMFKYIVDALLAQLTKWVKQLRKYRIVRDDEIVITHYQCRQLTECVLRAQQATDIREVITQMTNAQDVMNRDDMFFF